jgi:DNA-binding NtrC family response regulator
MPLRSDRSRRASFRLVCTSNADPSEEALAAMVHHHWPGNVRELKNAVERMVIAAYAGVARHGLAGSE